MEQPTTVDALYEAWVAKLQRQNAGLRALLVVVVGMVLTFVVAQRVVAEDVPQPAQPPKEDPK